MLDERLRKHPRRVDVAETATFLAAQVTIHALHGLPQSARSVGAQLPIQGCERLLANRCISLQSATVAERQAYLARRLEAAHHLRDFHLARHGFRGSSAGRSWRRRLEARH
jgi:hypothetical protein